MTTRSSTTGNVETENAAKSCPDGIVTETGTAADGSFTDRSTFRPPTPALPVSDTDAETDSPPGTEAFCVLTASIAVRFSNNVALEERKFALAVIVTVTSAGTATVVILNVADVEPCGTFTVAGTVADTLFVESDTS